MRKIGPYLRYYIQLPLAKALAPREGMLTYRNIHEDVKKLVASDDPTVVDGGSNRGAWIESLLKMYERPVVYAFEPNPESLAIVRKKFAGMENVKVSEKALGSVAGTKSFLLSDNDVSSSFLQRAERSHGTAVTVKGTVQTSIVRLDDEIEKADVIKLDLEGYELEALKGAERLLKNTKVVVTEVEFEEIYKGAPLYEDIALYLRGKGFSLFNFYDSYTQRDGQLTVADAIFANRKFIASTTARL